MRLRYDAKKSSSPDEAACVATVGSGVAPRASDGGDCCGPGKSYGSPGGGKAAGGARDSDENTLRFFDEACLFDRRGGKGPDDSSLLSIRLRFLLIWESLLCLALRLVKGRDSFSDSSPEAAVLSISMTETDLEPELRAFGFWKERKIVSFLPLLIQAHHRLLTGGSALRQSLLCLVMA